MLKAILAALKRIFVSGGKWVMEKGNRWIWQPGKTIVADMIDETGQMICRVGDGVSWSFDQLSKLIPGGSGGPAMPKKVLDLPDADEAKQAVSEARDQQEAADNIVTSAEGQVMAWAQSSPEERDTIPLTRLTDEQIDWLETRSRDEIKAIAGEKSEWKVAAALAGKPDAIFGVVSCGSKTRRPSPLEDRIVAFRSGDLGRPPAFVH